jgi:hypothetical protein
VFDGQVLDGEVFDGEVFDGEVFDGRVFDGRTFDECVDIADLRGVLASSGDSPSVDDFISTGRTIVR